MLNPCIRSQRWLLFCTPMLIFVVLVSCQWVAGEGIATAASSNIGMKIVWEEIVPTDIPTKEKPQKKPPRQRWISFGPRQTSDEYYDPFSAIRHNKQRRQEEEEEPHPLRTNEWLIQIKWKRKKNKNIVATSERMLLDFDPDGFVRWCKNVTMSTCHDSNDEKNCGGMKYQPPTMHQRVLTAIGTWTLHPSGVGWNLPVLADDESCRVNNHIHNHNNHDEEDGTHHNEPSCSSSTFYYQFHASFHPNPFGARPKMVRGIITQCRRRGACASSRWALRPVVGTFVGKGVGKDLYDLSFSKRGLGLPKQLVTPTTTTTTTTASSSS